MKTVKVKFLRDYKVRDDVGKEYKAGKVYEMNPRSANHFTRRQDLAIEVEKADMAETATAAPPETAAKSVGVRTRGTADKADVGSGK